MLYLLILEIYVTNSLYFFINQEISVKINLFLYKSL
jgi:hypothetical protein